MCKQIRLDAIRIDGDTQPRQEICTATVEEYASAYIDREPLPPLDVFHDGADYWLGDGFHRYHAAKAAGLELVDVRIAKGTVNECQWFSYAANQRHGLRRTNADKQKAVRCALLHPTATRLSDEQVATHIGVSRRMVLDMRNSLVNPTKKTAPPKSTCESFTSQTAAEPLAAMNSAASTAVAEPEKPAPGRELARMAARPTRRTSGQSRKPSHQPNQNRTTKPAATNLTKPTSRWRRSRSHSPKPPATMATLNKCSANHRRCAASSPASTKRPRRSGVFNRPLSD